MRGFGIADTGDGTRRWVLRKRRAPTAGGPGDRAAKAKYEVFAITVNGRNTIGVVPVDLERGVPVRKSITGTGRFAGSSIIRL
jgi:hypothetical protein